MRAIADYFYSRTALKHALSSLPDFHDKKYLHLEYFQVVVPEPMPVLSESWNGQVTADLPPRYTFKRDRKLLDWVLIKIE